MEYVFLFDILSLAFSKLRFYQKGNLKKCDKAYSEKRSFWHYRLQLFFVYKIVSQISFNLFDREIRGFLSKFLRKLG